MYAIRSYYGLWKNSQRYEDFHAIFNFLTKEKKIDLKTFMICKNCRDDLKNFRLPKFSALNGVKIEPVPPEISCLNDVEKMMIAPVAPLKMVTVLYPHAVHAGKMP